MEERLVRVGGVFLPKHIQIAPAVVGDAPAPPCKLSFRETVPLPHLALFRGPHGSGRRFHGVFRVFVPGEEHGQKVVFPGHGGIPALFEILIAVGGAFDNHHGPRLCGDGLKDSGQCGGLAVGPLRPESVFGDMDKLQGVRPTDALAPGGGAPEPGPEAGVFFLFRGAPGGVFKDKFLGVAGLEHGPHGGGHGVVEEFAHPEQVRGGVVPVGHNQGVHVPPGGAPVEDQRLGEGGKTQLPGFQNDNSHRLPGLLLLAGGGVQFFLRPVQFEGDHLAALGPDAQKILDILVGDQGIHSPLPPCFASQSSMVSGESPPSGDSPPVKSSSR